MKRTFVVFIAAMALASVPLFGADEPTIPTPTSSTAAEPCCALPTEHGLVVDAPDVYQLLGVVTDPRDPRSIDPVAVSTKLAAFKRKCRSDAELRTAEVIEILTERKTHKLYDWFLAHLRANHEMYQGSGLEHVALFDQFFLYLGAKRGRGVHLEPFEYQQELVNFLATSYRASGRYDAEPLQEEVERTQREAELARKAAQAGLRNVLNGPWPWVLSCASALAVAGVIAYHQFRPDGIAPVENRLPQVIDRDTIRHPVQPPPEAPAVQNDPAFQHGKEAAEDLFGPPPAKRP